MRRGDHHADGLAVELLAPQGSEDTDSEHDRVERTPSTIGPITQSLDKIHMEGDGPTEF